ncbi:MAG: hypothetical protein IVW36_00430 [Dehalococcoidia bacterium]|nr:hypothetical protein [Dehalococcoidia bacterium]
MDERGRLPLPPRYRDAFRNGIVLSQGSPDTCVQIQTQEAFDKRAAEWMAASSMERRGRVRRRALMGRSWETKLDAQNRVLIPPPLREFARLSGTVLLVGTGELFEVWAPDEYTTEMERVDDELPANLESIQPWERER